MDAARGAIDLIVGRVFCGVAISKQPTPQQLQTQLLHLTASRNAEPRFGHLYPEMMQAKQSASPMRGRRGMRRHKQ
jgi:hypothetical protein